MKVNIIERTLWLGLLLSSLALFGVATVMMACVTLVVLKLSSVVGYVTVVAIEVACIIQAIKERRDGGIVFVIAGVIYALAIVLL